MEPLDAVVKLAANSCEIWAGDQFQTVDQANAAATAGLKPEQVKIHTLLRRRQLRPARQHGLRLYRRGGVDRQGARRQRHAGQAAMDARRRHSRRALSPALPPPLEAALDDERPAGRLAASHRRPVDHGRHVVRRRHGQRRHRRHLRRGRGQSALRRSQHVGRTEHDRDRRAGIMVARRRQFAHGLCDRSLHRRDRARGRQGSVRLPPGDARTSSAPQGGAGTGCQGGRTGAARCRKARAAASPSPRRSAPTWRRSPR